MTSSNQTFKRVISDCLIRKLKKEELFNNYLLPDIKEGKVFPAIRNQRVDFYYKGGKLFQYDIQEFKTHIKYAAVIKDKGKDYLTKSELKDYRLPLNFSTNYDRIKENCANYAGIENSGIANIYKKFTYFKKKTDIVVLDIEISLKSLDEEKKQDRIDMLLFNTKEKKLLFVEAKHYINKDIRSKQKNVPKVFDQIKRYENQIKDKRSYIIEEYNKYIKATELLFNTNIPPIEKIDDKMILLIFGFDSDQKKGNLDKHDLTLKDNGIRTYTKGNIKTIELSSLWKINNRHL